MDDIYPITKIDASETPGSYDTGWQCFQFQIHNFEQTPIVVNQPLGPSIPFRCFGRNWSIDIFLGGRSDVLGGNVPVVSMNHVLGPSIDLETKVSSATNKIVHSVIAAKEPYTRTIKCGACLSTALATRQDILDNPNLYLDDGTYRITLCMKEKGGQNVPKTFIPKNPCSKSILTMLFSSNGTSTADVLFEVSSGLDEDSQKRRFVAHLCILRTCAPTLADLCEDYPSLTPVPIDNVKPIIFESLMWYIYGGELPSDLLKEHSKDIIKAADMYGISALKVEAEVAYVQSTEITIDNVVDNFYFADTMKCALLKEKVTEFMVDNVQEVLGKISLKDAPQSATLFHDVMTAVALGKNKNKDYDGDDPTKVKTMCINVLRRKLSERGLEIYGTREMLVASLEESYAKAKSSGEKRKRDEEETNANAAENE